MHGVPIREVACDGLGSPVDVDTAEELEALISAPSLAARRAASD
jgi:hypothetical protein